MPVTTTYPGLYVEELPSTTRTISAAPTSIAVFIGHTHPFKTKSSHIGKAVRISGFSEYESEFGGLYRNAQLDAHVPYAVRQFFLNGGAMAYVVALAPTYYDEAGEAKAYVPASYKLVPDNGAPASFFVFTAKEPVDSTFKLKMRVSNVRKTVTDDDTADIAIAYGSRAETYLGVTVATLVQRLAGSSLVSPGVSGVPVKLVAAEAELSYPSGTWDAAWTTFREADYAAVFATNGSLDKVDVFNLLLIPGIPGSHVALWSEALSFCEKKQAFAILDTRASTVADTSGLPDPQPTPPILTADQEVSSAFPIHRNGACYFPYVRTTDLLTGAEIALPPSGTVAGVFARTDTTRGVWKAPAGLEATLSNVSGVVPSGKMTDATAGVLNESGVNAIRTFPGAGTVVFGARTLVTANTAYQHWRYVSVRRMALFLEQTLLRNLGWAVFEPNDEPLWLAIRSSVETFLLGLYRQGAFQGATPSEAFFVKCDATTTTQEDIDNGKVKIVVGFRPVKPAEFVIIQIAQIAGQMAA